MGKAWKRRVLKKRREEKNKTVELFADPVAKPQEITEVKTTKPKNAKKKKTTTKKRSVSKKSTKVKKK